MDTLEILNKYSNLIVGAVTCVYVVLTWMMVREMRRSREESKAPAVTVLLLPVSSPIAEIQVQNFGVEPALNVVCQWQFEPLLNTSPITFKISGLSPGVVQHFDLPHTNDDPSKERLFLEICEKHQTLRVSAKWDDLKGKTYQRSSVYDLRDTAEGWYKAYWND